MCTRDVLDGERNILARTVMLELVNVIVSIDPVMRAYI